MYISTISAFVRPFFKAPLSFAIQPTHIMEWSSSATAYHINQINCTLFNVATYNLTGQQLYFLKFNYINTAFFPFLLLSFIMVHVKIIFYKMVRKK